MGEHNHETVRPYVGVMNMQIVSKLQSSGPNRIRAISINVNYSIVYKQWKINIKSTASN